MAEPKLIKICLTNKGNDSETPWATDLGPAPNAPPSSLKVKLVNVPFKHAKPTWGDIIVVSPRDGQLTWDRDGVPWKQIPTKILEDGGRWAMMIDYAPNAGADDALFALSGACVAAGIVCEGAWAPRDTEPGRVYLAVQKKLTAEQVMETLEAAHLPLTLTQIHPEPKKPATPPAKPSPAKADPPARKAAPAIAPPPPAAPTRKSSPVIAAPARKSSPVITAQPKSEPVIAAPMVKAAATPSPAKAAAKPNAAKSAPKPTTKPAEKAAAKPAGKSTATAKKAAAPAKAKKPAKKK